MNIFNLKSEHATIYAIIIPRQTSKHKMFLFYKFHVFTVQQKDFYWTTVDFHDYIWHITNYTFNWNGIRILQIHKTSMVSTGLKSCGSLLGITHWMPKSTATTVTGRFKMKQMCRLLNGNLLSKSRRVWTQKPCLVNVKTHYCKSRMLTDFQTSSTPDSWKWRGQHKHLFNSGLYCFPKNFYS